MNGNSFAKILTALSGPHGGTWVYRRAWGSGSVKICIVTNKGTGKPTHFAMDTGSFLIDWHPSTEDLFANDWEFAP